jgi:ribosome modulation factor
MDMTESTIRLMERGRKAALAGKPSDSFLGRSEREYSAWEMGWIEGHAERVDAAAEQAAEARLRGKE